MWQKESLKSLRIAPNGTVCACTHCVRGFKSKLAVDSVQLPGSAAATLYASDYVTRRYYICSRFAPVCVGRLHQDIQGTDLDYIIAKMHTMCIVRPLLVFVVFVVHCHKLKEDPNYTIARTNIIYVLLRSTLVCVMFCFVWVTGTTLLLRCLVRSHLPLRGSTVIRSHKRS